MRKMLLASVAMLPVLVSAAVYAADTASQADVAIIAPGQGSITDGSGNVWTITSGGGIEENGQRAPGGGGTSALAIIDGTVWGQDSGHGPVNPGGWFALSSSDQYWIATPTSRLPTELTDPVTAPTTPVATPTTPAVTPTTPAPTPVATPTPTTTPVATPTTPTSPCALPTSSGQFGILNGVIYDANQQPFIPNGVGVLKGQEPALATLTSTFPGVTHQSVS